MSDLASLLAGASALFSRDSGINLQIQYMRIQSAGTSYDDSSIRAFRHAASRGMRRPDITHMFTGAEQRGRVHVGAACGHSTGKACRFFT